MLTGMRVGLAGGCAQNQRNTSRPAPGKRVGLSAGWYKSVRVSESGLPPGRGRLDRFLLLGPSFVPNVHKWLQHIDLDGQPCLGKRRSLFGRSGNDPHRKASRGDGCWLAR